MPKTQKTDDFKKERKPINAEQRRAANRLLAVWEAKKKELTLSQERVGLQFGWTQGAVGQYLNGKIPLNIKALINFSKVLCVLPEDIYPEMAKIIAAAGALTNDGDNPLPQVDGGRTFHLRHVRAIKILNYIQAGSPRETVDQYEPGGGMDSLAVDEELASELGPHAYALVIEGESMLAEFRPGDHIIIDPDVRPNPGDFVVAKMDVDQAATFKKYRPRGTDKDGNQMFDLVPLNEDYPTIVVNADNRGHVIGTMVEHRRRRRRS